MSWKPALHAITRENPRVVGFSGTLKDELVRGAPSGRAAIRVYVSEKLPPHALPPAERLPDEIGGIPVDVLPLGRLEALAATG